jgi:hypothetical protein
VDFISQTLKNTLKLFASPHQKKEKMGTRIISIVLLLFVCKDSFTQELKKEYQKLVSNFIYGIKNDKKESIANIVIYPFERDYPIPNIKNKQEFIKRFDDIFDDSLKQIIIKSNPATDWSDMGWRGIMLFNGEVWLDFDGSLSGVNYKSRSESKLQAKLIENEKRNIYSSLSHYLRPICILETSTYRIRIDDLGNENYRYACWSISKSQKDKPDLILEGGEYSPDGSGGNHSFQFKNAVYIYKCYFIVLRSPSENDPPVWLTVYKDDKEILKQRARIINK